MGMMRQKKTVRALLRKILAIHAKCLRIQDFYRERKNSVRMGVVGVRHRWSKKPPPRRMDGLFGG